MRLAVAGQKGGAGKSTLAVNVAAELHDRGVHGLLVDADPQGTALRWAQLARDQGHAGPDTLAVGEDLRARLPAALATRGSAFCVIDCPGRLGKRQVGAFMLAQTALGDRAVYREALAAGQGVTRYARGRVAALEVRHLVDELEARVGHAPAG